MKVELKEKNWLWKLTLFAANNYTTIGNIIYHPKNKKPSRSVIDHELIHMRQQNQVGLVRFILLYLFCCPFLYNPFRWKWEYEAYTKGSRITDSQTIKKLRSKEYGWLFFNGR